MIDLILPHAARDARLVAEHPDWFRRGPTASSSRPILANPNDPRRPRVHGRPGRARPRRCRARAAARSTTSSSSRGHYLRAGRRRLPLQRRLQGAAGPAGASSSARLARAPSRRRLPGGSAGLPVRAVRGARRLRLRPDLRQQPLVGLPRPLVPRPVRGAAPDRAHGGLPGGPQHAAPRRRVRRRASPRRSPGSTAPATWLRRASAAAC